MSWWQVGRCYKEDGRAHQILLSVTLHHASGRMLLAIHERIASWVESWWAASTCDNNQQWLQMIVETDRERCLLLHLHALLTAYALRIVCVYYTAAKHSVSETICIWMIALYHLYVVCLLTCFVASVPLQTPWPSLMTWWYWNWSISSPTEDKGDKQVMLVVCMSHRMDCVTHHGLYKIHMGLCAKFTQTMFKP